MINIFCMNQAILITAYKDICQLKRLINKMQDFFIYVHIDKKAKGLYSDLRKEYKKNDRVKIVSKYSISWGSYNHLRAVVYLMNLVEHNSGVKYIHVVSGQDYPVVNTDTFAKFEFCKNVYLTCKRVTETNDAVLGRYIKKHLLTNFIDIRSDLYNRLDKRLAKYRERIGCFDVGELYKGMIWVSMPLDVCQYVLTFIRSNKGRGFFYGLKYSEIPEEVFFQTIIMHSRYRDFVVSDNLRYTLWQEKNGSNPGILDKSDYESIHNSNAVFARKIDSNYSIELIKLIDKEKQNDD